MIISESKRQRYRTKITNKNATIYSDVLPSNGNKEELLGPYDLLCASLAACMNITTRMILEKMNITYRKIIIKVDINSEDEKNTTFVYDLKITGEISEEVRKIVLDELAISPITQTLCKKIKIEGLES